MLVRALPIFPYGDRSRDCFCPQCLSDAINTPVGLRQWETTHWIMLRQRGRTSLWLVQNQTWLTEFACGKEKTTIRSVEMIVFTATITAAEVTVAKALAAIVRSTINHKTDRPSAISNHSQGF